MAKKRYIDTRFRSDGYIADLSPIEKLVFIYFLSSQYTNLSGIYEIPLKQILLDTGIDDIEELQKIIDKFTEGGKIFYIDGWVCIKNFQKHQNLDNIKIKGGIKNEIQSIPTKILKKIGDIDKSLISHIGDITSNIDIDLDGIEIKGNGKGKDPSDQEDKIREAQERRAVNTRGQFWIKIWNDITGRNDLMEDATFRGLKKIILNTLDDDFKKRVELFNECKRYINQYKLGKFLDVFGQNNIHEYSITDFIKKINLFGGNREEVFNKITSKDYIKKVIRTIKDGAITLNNATMKSVIGEQTEKVRNAPLYNEMTLEQKKEYEAEKGRFLKRFGK